MSNCVVDDQNRIFLTDLFKFVSRFERQTGFGLSDIYEWLNPDITEPEIEGEGYRWEEAKADYELFQSESKNNLKRIPVEIANAFFSVCENFKVYGGWDSVCLDVTITKPLTTKLEGRVFVIDFKEFLKIEQERTGIKNHILWKILPEEISTEYKLSAFLDAFKYHNGRGTLPKKVTEAIKDTYSKVPDEAQEVSFEEGLVVPPFGSKHSFSVASDIALNQLREAIEVAKAKGIYASTYAFTKKTSAFLQADVAKLFEKNHNTFPRLRVAICLALLEGHKIPQEVLDVHSDLLEMVKSRNKPTHEMKCLAHIR